MLIGWFSRGCVQYNLAVALASLNTYTVVQCLKKPLNYAQLSIFYVNAIIKLCMHCLKLYRLEIHQRWTGFYLRPNPLPVLHNDITEQGAALGCAIHAQIRLDTWPLNVKLIIKKKI